jgi:hypothetical protein
MDQCGACKFPADKLPRVLEFATELAKREVKERQKFMDPNFSYAKWKAEVKGKHKDK